MQVLAVDQVAKSLDVLRGLGVHRNTVMYLCIKRAAAQQQTDENIKLDFQEFFGRFLTVRNAPTDKPYIIPFEASSAKLWLNPNLAGSFAPSSIRQDNPIRQVVDINGKGLGVRYALKPSHSRKAFGKLLNKTKIPVLDLAAFLYRDFGFDTERMDVQKLLNIFQAEFGYLSGGTATDEFNEIFTHDPILVQQDIFVPFLQAH